jgi:hypothetical protein
MRSMGVRVERLLSLPGRAGHIPPCFFRPQRANGMPAFRREECCPTTQAQFVSLSGYSAEYRRKRRKCQEQIVIENSADQTAYAECSREYCQRLWPEKSLSWKTLWAGPSARSKAPTIALSMGGNDPVGSLRGGARKVRSPLLSTSASRIHRPARLRLLEHSRESRLSGVAQAILGRFERCVPCRNAALFLSEAGEKRARTM